MSRVVAPLLFVLAVAVPAVTGRAQSSTSTLFSEVARSVRYLQDEDVQRELQLTAEQIAAFKSINMTETLRAALGASREDRAERFTAALEDITKKTVGALDERQAARFRQIVLQQKQRDGQLLSLIQDPFAKAELQLTEEQSQQTQTIINELQGDLRRLSRSDSKRGELTKAANQKLDEALTAEQRQSLATLLGSPFDKQLSPSRAPPGSRAAGLAFEVGSLSRNTGFYVIDAEVQADLQLTEEQKKQVADIYARLGASGETLTRFSNLLNEEQTRRAFEIFAQNARVRSGFHTLFRFRDVVEALALTDEQRERITALVRSRLGDSGAASSGSDGTENAASFKQLEAEITAMLTDEQRTKLTAVIGKPFAGTLPIILPGFGRPRPPSGTPSVASRGFRVGAYGRSPWSYLRNRELRAELQLSPDQQRGIRELFATGGRESDAKASDLLTQQQKTRLYQVQLQSLRARAGFYYPFRYRDVAESLALTDAQKEQINALVDGASDAGGREIGVPIGSPSRATGRLESQITELLTEEQRMRLGELFGEPFDGGLPLTISRYTVGDAVVRPTRLVLVAAVADDLKLSEDQRKRFAELFASSRFTTPAAVNDVLTPEQTGRYSQIHWQVFARRSGPEQLFRYHALVDDMGLTIEQKVKIFDLAEDNAQSSATRERIHAEDPEKLKQRDQQVLESLQAVLTPEQRESLTQLLGEPFEVELEPPYGFAASQPKPSVTSSEHKSEVYTLTFSPDDSTVASASIDGTVRLWNAADGRLAKVLTQRRPGFYSVAYSPDGKSIAVGAADGFLQVLSAETGRPSWSRQAHHGAAYAVAFSPDGSRLASAGGDGNIQTREVSGGELLWQSMGHPNLALAVAYSPDGRTLVSGGGRQDNGEMCVWNPDSGELLTTFIAHESWVRCLAFAPDGRSLASAGQFDCTAKLWDTGTWRMRNTLVGHEVSVLGVAFADQGATLVTAGGDKTVRLWKAGDGSLLLILSDHTDAVRSVAVSRDGHRLASAGHDRIIQLWDLTDSSHPTRLNPAEPATE